MDWKCFWYKNLAPLVLVLLLGMVLMPVLTLLPLIPDVYVLLACGMWPILLVIAEAETGWKDDVLAYPYSLKAVYGRLYLLQIVMAVLAGLIVYLPVKNSEMALRMSGNVLVTGALYLPFLYRRRKEAVGITMAFLGVLLCVTVSTYGYVRIIAGGIVLLVSWLYCMLKK